MILLLRHARASEHERHRTAWPVRPLPAHLRASVLRANWLPEPPARGATHSGDRAFGLHSLPRLSTYVAPTSRRARKRRMFIQNSISRIIEGGHPSDLSAWRLTSRRVINTHSEHTHDSPRTDLHVRSYGVLPVGPYADTSLTPYPMPASGSQSWAVQPMRCQIPPPIGRDVGRFAGPSVRSGPLPPPPAVGVPQALVPLARLRGVPELAVRDGRAVAARRDTGPVVTDLVSMADQGRGGLSGRSDDTGGQQRRRRARDEHLLEHVCLPEGCGQPLRFYR